MRQFGNVAMGQCGDETMWQCGNVAMRQLVMGLVSLSFQSQWSVVSIQLSVAVFSGEFILQNILFCYGFLRISIIVNQFLFLSLY